jgi:hypothetical protein
MMSPSTEAFVSVVCCFVASVVVALVLIIKEMRR